MAREIRASRSIEHDRLPWAFRLVTARSSSVLSDRREFELAGLMLRSTSARRRDGPWDLWNHRLPDSRFLPVWCLKEALL
jgi:hypothetical protein